MTASRRRFSPEFKNELGREVISISKPIKEVADVYGVDTETLRNWLAKHREANGGTEEELVQFVRIAARGDKLVELRSCSG